MVLYLKKLIGNNRVVFFVLLFFIFIVYANALGNALVIDDIVTINDPKIRLFSWVTRHPFAFIHSLIYYVIINLFGPNATAFRLISVAFHVGMVWMIFLLLSTTVNRITAFLTASLYAVHPILVESITWISGGPYSRYSFFVITSLFFYILSSRRKTYYWLSIVFFLLALPTSEKAIVFPGILLFYEIALSDIKKNWKKLIPFFIFSCLLIFLVYFPQIGQRVAEFQKNISVKPVFNNPLIYIPYAVTSYLQLIFWPIDLSIFHYQTKINTVEYVIRSLVFLILIGVTGFSFKKNKYIFFWLSFFLISLSPTLLPFGINWIVAERYVYLGTVGILFLLGYALARLLEDKRTEKLAISLFIIIMALFMTRTIMRNLDWKNEESLWLATEKTAFFYHGTHNKLGEVYERKGDLNKAVKEYKLALKINPNYPEAYSNLGAAYLKMNKLDEALKAFNQAVKLNPWLWQPYQNIAVVYYLRGLYDEAIKYTKYAIERVPKTSNLYVKANSELYFNLGSIYLQKGDKTKSREYLTKVLEFNPNDQKTKKILQDASLWAR